jgi:hypothetical protein
MRLLVLALLVANAAFFTWRYNEQVEANILAARREAALAPLAPNTPSLTLVSELDELPPRRGAPKAAEAATGEATATLVAPPEPAAPVEDRVPAERATLDDVGAAETWAAVPPAAPATSPGSPDAPPAAAAGEVPAELAPAAAPSGLAVTPTASTAATEPPPAAGEASPAPEPVVARGAPSGVCVHIGPFAVADEYAPLVKWLTPRSTTVNVETVTTNKRQLFWVYLEQKSADEAQARLAELKRKGIRDTLLVNRDGFRNAISLGVFSSQDAVNRRLAEIERKGYKPVVVPRIETTDLRWLNVEFAAGYEDKRRIPAELRGNAGVEDIACSRLAGRGAKARDRG